MSFYRSDDVSFYRLVIPRENAWDIMNKLGNHADIQVNRNYYIFFHKIPPSYPGPSSPPSEDVKKHSTISDPYKKICKKRIYTKKKIHSQIKPIMNSSDCGINNTPKVADIQPTSSTTSSDKSSTLGAITKIL